MEKTKCRECGKTLVVPTWKVCNECDGIAPEPRRRVPTNPYMKKYQDDHTPISELQKTNPANKKRVVNSD